MDHKGVKPQPGTAREQPPWHMLIAYDQINIIVAAHALSRGCA